jgi:RNA polymerase sigma factor (sigma-70 family)
MSALSQTSSLSELLSHSDWLRILARKLVADDATAEDLVQETWLAAMKNPPAVDRPARPWLAGVVRNLAKLRYRTETRRSKRQGVVALEQEDLPSAAQLVEQVETERQLAATVLALDEPFRTTVLLRYFQDLSLAEIAARQGVPAATVRWRHARGLELLRNGLDQEYGDTRTWCQALIVLARAASPERDGAVLSGSVLASASALLAALKTLVVAFAIIGVLWLGISSVRDWLNPSEMMEGLVARDSGGQASPEERWLDGSGLAADSRRMQAAGFDPEALSAPEEDAQGPAYTLRVHVVDDATGEDTTGREVVVVDLEERAHKALVNSAGWAEFENLIEPVYLYINRPGSFAHGEPIADRGDEIRIHLPAGKELRGRAFLDGAPAPSGIELCLLWDAPLFRGRDWDDDLTADIFEKLGADLRAVTTIGESGSFHFTGLEEDWNGVLYVPESFRLSPVHPPAPHLIGGGTVRFERAQGCFELYMEQHPRVIGSVMEANGQEPVEYANVLCIAIDKKGERVDLETTTASDGEFEIRLMGSDYEELKLVYSAEDGRGHMLREFELERGTSVQDLGDLLLSDSELCFVQVTDAEGDPIAGAVVSGSEFGPFSLPTDISGSTMAYLSTGEDSLLEVTALGYGTVRVKRPKKDGESLKIELGRTSSLLVELLLPKRVRHAGLSMLLEGRGSALRLPSHGRDAGHGGVLNIRFGEEPQIEVVDLISGQSLILSILGPDGSVLSSKTIEELEQDERRKVEIDLIRRSRKAHFVLQDESGGRIKGGDLLFRLNGEEFIRTTSDRTGSFRQDFMPLEGLSLEVSMRGYCSRSFENDDLSPKGARQVFYLERARDVELDLQGRGGNPVRVHSIVARAADRDEVWHARQAQDGTFVLIDVPKDDLELTVRTSDGVFTHALDAGSREFTIRQ